MDFGAIFGGGGGGGPTSSASAESTQGGDTITFAGQDQATTLALIALAVVAVIGLAFALRK
jgi:hypothetical protein